MNIDLQKHFTKPQCPVIWKPVHNLNCSPANSILQLIRPGTFPSTTFDILQFGLLHLYFNVHVSLLNSAILNYFCTLYCIFFPFFLFSADLSTIQGLFVQLTHLLCNKLVVIRSSRWKSDLHITLSAFELLSSLAQLSMDHLGKEDLMYVVVEFYPCFKFYSSLSFFLGMVMYIV